jgi:cell cycle sensor histidine kinase DivJ
VFKVKRHLPGLDIKIRRGQPAEDQEQRPDAFRAMVEGTADLVMRYAPNGEALYVSPSALAVTGSDPDALTGQGMVRRVHVADLPAYLKGLSDAFNGRDPGSVEFRVRHGEERFIAMEMRCSPLRDRDGKVEAVVAVTRDVSDRRHLERELLAARETAERASIAKTHFLAHMSHELRTPLNAIIGFAEILESEVTGVLPPERRREYARLIHSSGQHLLEVVNGILDMSKIECGLFDVTFEPLEVGPLVDLCREMILGQARERGVTVSRDLPSDLPELHADRRALKQILINLLSNGVKFTNRGGAVRIAAEVDDRAMRFIVRDNGIGIAPDDLPRLGTPFTQADAGYERRYEGTGLGLSVVKGLASLHGGDMRIDSILGGGTTVTVALPLKPDATAGMAPRRNGEMKEFKRAG